MSPIYINLIKNTYGKASYYRVLRWRVDYDLEQSLFTKYHLSNIDLIAIKAFLHANR